MKILYIGYRSKLIFPTLYWKLRHIYKVILNKPMEFRIQLSHRDLIEFYGDVPKRKQLPK